MRGFLRSFIMVLAVSVVLSGAVLADDAGTIDHGQKGVADGAPVNILQVTKYVNSDWEPSWGPFHGARTGNGLSISPMVIAKSYAAESGWKP